MMYKRRHVIRCSQSIRRVICGKVWCTRYILLASVIVFTVYLIALSPPNAQYVQITDPSTKYRQESLQEHGSQQEQYFHAYFQYAGNIPYVNGAYLSKKVLESSQNDKSIVLTDGSGEFPYRQFGFKEYRNEFLESINVSDVPLNRTAFGPMYTLNETRSNLYEFPYMINGSAVCKDSPHPFLVIMVLSMHTHIDTRAAIRSTWGRAASPGVWPKVGDLKHKVKLVFLFGKANNELGNSIVKEESKMYGDIVQADFVDSYFNLTYKTVTGIRWVAEFCKDANYILKADEDVFVHVHNLVNFLTKREKKNHGVIFGHALMKSDVFREGRWAVTTHAYPLSVYPTYTCGNTYVISGKMAAHIYYTAGLLPYLNIEDVFVTGIVRLFLNGELVDVPGFTHWFEKKPKPCEFKNTVRISATKVTDFMQGEIWEGLKTKEANCYKLVKVRHVKTNRPERVARGQLVRDEHIFMNKTSGTFYAV